MNCNGSNWTFHTASNSFDPLTHRLHREFPLHDHSQTTVTLSPLTTSALQRQFRDVSPQFHEHPHTATALLCCVPRPSVTSHHAVKIFRTLIPSRDHSHSVFPPRDGERSGVRKQAPLVGNSSASRKICALGCHFLLRKPVDGLGELAPFRIFN